MNKELYCSREEKTMKTENQSMRIRRKGRKRRKGESSPGNQEVLDVGDNEPEILDRMKVDNDPLNCASRST